MVSDLEIAKKHLVIENKTLVLAKNGKILASGSGKGIAELVGFIETMGDKLAGASLADKVVGKAVAMLVRYAGISALHADLMSEPARNALNGTDIVYSFEKLVPNIINRTGDGLCPMEKLSLPYDDPAEAALALRAKLIEMRQNAKNLWC